MADILGGKLSGNSGVFMGEDVKLTFKSGDMALAQTFSITYARNLQPVYGLGGTQVWWSSMHQAGTAQFQRVLSSGALSLRNFGLGCEPETINLTLENGCNKTQARANYSLNGCLLSSVGYSAQVGQAYVTQDVSVMFSMMS